MDLKYQSQPRSRSEAGLRTIFGFIPFGKWTFGAHVVCGLFAVFYLPSFVPLRPSISDSYVFGYNNRVGVVLVLLFVGTAAVWTKGMGFQFSTGGHSKLIPIRVLFLSLVAVLCGCVLMYWFAGRYGGFGESSYAIDRAWLLSRGKTPYVDFEFAYGPLFLYGPVLFQRLFSIDIASAYYIFWILTFLLGTTLLFFNVNMIDYPSPSKLSIFLLLFIPGLFSIVCMGTNYAPLRFSCPIFFILVLDRVLRRAGRNSQAHCQVLAIAFTITLFLISPETAVAFAFASVFMFQFSSPNPGIRPTGPVLSLLGAYAILFWAAMNLHLLDTLKADAGGADSFPIAFAPHILLFFAGLFFCACYFFARFSNQRLNDNTFGLILYSIPMLAAALGRCDPGHVALNGTGIFTACLFYASNDQRLWRPCKFAFIPFMCALPILTGLLFYSPQIQKVRNLNSLRLSGGSGENQIDLKTLYPSWRGQFAAPFGYQPNGIGTFLSDRVDYGHFEPFVNENTVDATNQRLREMKDHEERALLLPRNYERYCTVNVRTERVLISVLFAFPYFGKAVHTSSVWQPICDFIQANYRLEQPPNAQNFGYGLWVRKSLDTLTAPPH